MPKPPKRVLDLSPGTTLHLCLFQSSLCPPACLPGSPSLLAMFSGARPTWEGVPRARNTLAAGQLGFHGHAILGLPHPWMPSTSAAVGAGSHAGAGRAQLLAAGMLGAHTRHSVLPRPQTQQFPFSRCSARPGLLLALEAAKALPSPCAAWPCSDMAPRLPLLLLLFIDSTEHPLLLVFAIFLQRAGSDEGDTTAPPLWLYLAGPGASLRRRCWRFAPFWPQHPSTQQTQAT